MMTLGKQYKICTKCIMDTSVEDIVFDEAGVCNYCNEFLARSGDILNKSNELKTGELNLLVKNIKDQGKGKPYDCIVGVSGGVDSSWVLVKVVELGLRPLAVHMDNGWNSELAQNNIANLIGKLGVDLYTHVINWSEYKGLMQAFFDADVIDVELLYDNAMLAVNYQMARKYNLKHILAGTNQATEGMKIPSNWNWFKYDKKNIYGLARKFGEIKIKSLPTMGTIDYINDVYFKGIKWRSFLDNFPYNKFEALDVLKREYNYKPYPYKHYESIFTRFYQGYILPKKFSADKRRVHLSTLVVAGQMSREDALTDLKKLPYPSEKALEEDIDYFIKKMGWTKKQLDEYLRRPEIAHSNYPTEKPFWNFFSRLLATYRSYIGK
jgi:N-acetyl sugar amidotransferase